MALVSTERVQCYGMLARGEARCAVGIFADEVMKLPIYDSHGLNGMLSPSDWQKLHEALPEELRRQIVDANDFKGASFDDIAKIVKDFPV